LYLLTADRPRRFRGSGAPQAAEQENLFGLYAPSAFDLEADEPLDLSSVACDVPVHINACFEDPKGIASGAGPEGGVELVEASNVQAFLKKAKRLLVVVGELAASERPGAASLLQNLAVPAYLETTSGLRGQVETELCVAEKLLVRFEPDALLRVGGVPTHRLWRDLEDRFASLPVLSISRAPFSGLARRSQLYTGPFSAWEPGQYERSDNLLEDDRVLWTRLKALLNAEPLSEAGMVHALSQMIPDGGSVFLGNSLPIRDWDLAADRSGRRLEVAASRGLNGIDGQLSTFLGGCAVGRSNWALLGDLTTLYDLAGPWPIAQLDPAIDANLVVLNNGGGKIFDRMFPAAEFQNRHDLSFRSWAEMWGAQYLQPLTPSEIPPSKPGLRIIELRPDPEATGRFWHAYEELLA
jgi:2-succinyl-5-enolpyruvyl-6-hydroxy-3-cyclohexene-1-carboxylate synthase